MKKIIFRDWINTVKEKWEPEDVAFINETALRVAKIEGAYDWHVHPREDEFFMVLKGKVFIDTDSEDGTVELNELEGYRVGQGIKHRSRAKDPAWILLIEPTRTMTKGVKST